jgi:hypothetical protein
MRLETQPDAAGEGLSRLVEHLGPEASNGKAALYHALVGLKEAVAHRKVEEICGAYQAVRKTARGMAVKDMIEGVKVALGPSGIEVVVSAYAHRRCFMCSGGAVACDHCEGTGQVQEGRPCPFCDGLGIAPCAFCRGTGWPDRDTVPSELAEAVSLHHAARVRKDLKRVEETFSTLTEASAQRLPEKRRREIAAWLQRLQARVAVLTEDESIPGEEQRMKLAAEGMKIADYLNILQAGGTRAGAPEAP